MYFGEYPLAFAACTNQLDCYRLLRAKRADPNQKDTNGNTVLHMTVIHENLEMLKLAYDTGAKLQVMNKQSLTPLTLAAKIAKKKMFEQILQLESTVVWNYGEASSIAYPLAKLDTINQETGHLNEDSALFLAAYGETKEHLEMLDGLLENLLQAKWDAFAKKSWTKSLICFVIYFIFLSMAFMTRPFSLTTSVLMGDSIYILPGTIQPMIDPKYVNFTLVPEGTTWPNRTYYWPKSDGYVYREKRCHLTNYFNYGWQGYVRIASEAVVIFCVIYQVIVEGLEIRAIGYKRWWQVLSSFPFKILYRISLIFILLLIPIRLLCFLDDTMLFLDNLFSMLVIIMTALHFLFYFRAMKFVGPFVVMIYTIFIRDMVRFFAIYAIFLIGFTHSFYIIFIACERKRSENDEISELNLSRVNILANPLEGLLRLFICTIGEFTVLYKEINTCDDDRASNIGKIVFLVYELFVSLLQFNLLIAMMTRTYEMIYHTQKEYKRQWAQVILMTELSHSPQDRLMALLKYSRPIGTDKRKRAFVVTRKHETFSESEKLMKEQQANAIREEKRLLLKRRLRVRSFFCVLELFKEH
uniref:Ion transport domain-containing protein n=1 Tax=Panagrolaimus superbus TaxID=310955 RepID=A0A914YX26_9BILA